MTTARLHGGPLALSDISDRTSSSRQKPLNKAMGNRGESEMSFGMEEEFVDRWSAYLRENFDTNKQIAQVFQVTERTVEYWRAGTTEPRGRALARALRRNPEAIPYLIGDLDA